MEHRDLVSALVKHPKQILYEMSEDQMNALHMAVGIAGEAGELLDAVKSMPSTTRKSTSPT